MFRRSTVVALGYQQITAKSSRRESLTWTICWFCKWRHSSSRSHSLSSCTHSTPSQISHNWRWLPSEERAPTVRKACAPRKSSDWTRHSTITTTAWISNLNQVTIAPFACFRWKVTSALSFPNAITNTTRRASLSGSKRKQSVHFASVTSDKNTGTKFENYY